MGWIYNALLLLAFSIKRGVRPFTFKKGLFSDFRMRKEGEIRIWIHASSLGETKAVGPLIDAIQRDLPQAKIAFSSATATGYKEACASHKKVDLCFRLPIDLSWVMKNLVKEISPDLFILVESEFWPNLFAALKRENVTIALVNGRVSERSHRSFKRISWITRPMFSSIDLCCVQDGEYLKRFQDLGTASEKIFITGNLKYDLKKEPKIDSSLLFPEGKRLITIASTHEKEEIMILSVLQEMDPSIGFLIAPRHPKRFSQVQEELKRANIPFRTISEKGQGEDRVVLVDKMGVLDQCFQNSVAAIVGGSFVSHIGGHNIYEPVQWKIPVLYGPYMYKQQGLVTALEKYGVGNSVRIEELKEALEKLLSQKIPEGQFQELQSATEGATTRSWNQIKSL